MGKSSVPVEKLWRPCWHTRNRDELCCVRAIVTMKAWVDHGSHNPDYLILRKGYPIQEKNVKELHCLAGVPKGPCSLKELQKFQDALPDYQIKVLAVDKPFSIIFISKTFSHKRILLIKVDDHYHGYNSYGGFLYVSYFCHDCNRGYNSEDIDNHRCQGKWCRSRLPRLQSCQIDLGTWSVSYPCFTLCPLSSQLLWTWLLLHS